MYQPILMEYYDRALFECLQKGAAHEPHILSKAFKLHTNMQEHGTMRIKNWD